MSELELTRQAESEQWNAESINGHEQDIERYCIDCGTTLRAWEGLRCLTCSKIQIIREQLSPYEQDMLEEGGLL